MDTLGIKVKMLSPEAALPAYAKPGDAGMDVRAVSKVKVDGYIEYGTGLAFEVPAGYVMLVFPRSSISNTSLSLTNSVGVLDSGYRGELKLRFRSHGSNEYEVGDRIGQIIVLPYPEISFTAVEDLAVSERGDGGFGSSGKG